MKFACHLSNLGWNAVWRVVGIDKHPKTYSMKTDIHEPFGAYENAISYEEKPPHSKVPNEWFFFTQSSAGGIKGPVGFPFSQRGVQEMGSKRRNHATY